MKSGTKPMLILQTGDAPLSVQETSGNYDRMFLQAGNLGAGQVNIVHLPRGERPQDPETYCGILITGSAAMVTDRLDWSEYAAGWLRQAVRADVPIFGVCYGHQLLAHALGGVVDYLADGMEVGTQSIEVLPAAANDPLIGRLPAQFKANLIHSQTVVTPPEGAAILARSARDPHQILRYSPNVVTTQFHPEFNAVIMEGFLTGMTAQEPDREQELARVGQELTNTPVSLALMAEFIRQCLPND